MSATSTKDPFLQVLVGQALFEMRRIEQQTGKEIQSTHIKLCRAAQKTYHGCDLHGLFDIVKELTALADSLE